MPGQLTEIAVQHVGLRVVDALLQRRRRTARDPGRIAHHDVGTLRGGGPEIRLLRPHPIRDSETVRVVLRAPHRARVDICRHDFPGSAPGQQDRENSRPRAEVKNQRPVDSPRPGRVGDQVDVLVTGGGKDAVGGVDALTQGGHLDARAVPLECADHPEELR